MGSAILDTTKTDSEIILRAKRDMFVSGQLVEKGKKFKTQDKGFADYQTNKGFCELSSEEEADPEPVKSEKNDSEKTKTEKPA